MSHVVTISTKLKDPTVLQRVCAKMGIACELAERGKKLVRSLFSGAVEGVASFLLPGWKYPVVVSEDGTARYDNYNGSWGDQAQLDSLTQNYAKDFAVESLRAKGYRVVEETVEQDGTMVVTMAE